MQQNSPSISVMRTPRSVDLEITSRCNLRCKYCYFFDNPEVNYQELPTGEWLEFIDELGQCSVMDVCLAGGEPFIRKDLPDLIEAIVKNRMRFSILSNGTLITDAIAEFIAETKRCDSVQVSIDGSCAEVHESGRGKGSFSKAVQGIRILKKHYIPVTVRMTIHRHNVHDLENTARFLLEELELLEFSTNAVGYVGSCQKNSSDLMLTVKDRELAMKTLARLSSKYDDRIIAAAGPLADFRCWERMERAHKSREPKFDNGGYLTGCGCTWEKITVRADGVLVPCSMLAHMQLGRINNDSLIKTWQQSQKLMQIRQRNTVSLSDFEFCKNCSFIPYCTGNCPALAYNLTGQVNQPSPDACLQKYLADGGRLPVF